MDYTEIGYFQLENILAMNLPFVAVHMDENIFLQKKIEKRVRRYIFCQDPYESLKLVVKDPEIAKETPLVIVSSDQVKYNSLLSSLSELKYQQLYLLCEDLTNRQIGPKPL